MWTGAMVAAVSLVLWCASEVWAVGWRSRGMVYVGITNGMFGVTEKHSGWERRSFEQGWQAERARGSQRLWVDTYFGGRDWWVWVPLWMPLSAGVMASGAAYALGATARRRARRGACAKCGYDRVGLAAGAKCPECGEGNL